MLDSQNTEEVKTRGGRGDRRGGHRGRGNRGGNFGRGGKKFNGKTDGKTEGKTEGEGDKHHHSRKEGRGNRRGPGPKDAPKDSFFYKFHYGPWPEVAEVEVKIDTELPEPIAKDDKLAEPSKDQYIKNMEHLDGEIQAVIEKIKKINREKESVYKRGVQESKDKHDADNEEEKVEEKSFKELVNDRNKILNEKKELDKDIKKKKTVHENASKYIIVIFINAVLFLIYS
jgi:hypothetical protein